MNVLFVCSRNRRRSPTAEVVFSGQSNVKALSAGTSPDAENPISADLIEWADLIFTMENIHRQRLQKKFGSALRTKQVIVLGIPDDYEYMDPMLIEVLKDRVARHL